MHEFNVCQSIINTVIEQVAGKSQNRPNILKTTVVIGALRPLVSEYLTFAYTYLAKGTAAEGSELILKRPQARGKCSRCGLLSERVEGSFRCVRCGGEKGEIIGGRELYIECIEVSN
ncbi:MAG: hydrogenase maturation nickel metallochaperone HypA [Chitinispirillaceae bacterium]|nr:hydrogenase maturation nickel metallochaperone HypA [Chitinispirillaceae bacterium]